jgi:Phytanoyl-CoA dioxygenase (PhyH)
MSAIENLSWEFVNTPQPLSGLAQLQFRMIDESRAGQAMRIRLHLGARNFGEREFQLDPNGKGEPWFAVHTQLLGNGEHTLTAEVLESVGESPLWTGTIPFAVANLGPLADAVAGSLRSRETPLFVAPHCDASSYDYADEALRPWFDRPDALERIAERERSGEITPERAEQFRQFVEQGYVILEGLIDDDLVDAVNAEIDQAVAAGYQGYKYGTSQRIEHLHDHYPSIRRLFLDRRYLDPLDNLFGARARPCQTLTYVFGSQQDAHQDTVHLTPFPAGYMCGVWIALQDIVPDSGELVVYPRSHRLPRVYLHEVGCAKVAGDWTEFGRTVVRRWGELIEQERLEPVVYRPKKGTVLIWHENLMHAGSQRRDQSLERRSIVIHTFADGAVVYYDSTGLVGHALHRDLLTSS